MNCLEREKGIQILKLFLSTLTPKFDVCNRVAKFDRNTLFVYKSLLPTWIKTKMAIFLVETAAFFIKKTLSSCKVSNRVCL